jgi:hypothetical protein
MSGVESTFKTGDKCDKDGFYGFVQYADGTARQQPTNEERFINLKKGDTFPPIKSAGAAAIWKVHRQTP